MTSISSESLNEKMMEAFRSPVIAAPAPGLSTERPHPSIIFYSFLVLQSILSASSLHVASTYDRTLIAARRAYTIAFNIGSCFYLLFHFAIKASRRGRSTVDTFVWLKVLVLTVLSAIVSIVCVFRRFFSSLSVGVFCVVCGGLFGFGALTTWSCALLVSGIFFKLVPAAKVIGQD